MGARRETRARMVTGAAMLLREKGVRGTTVGAVLERTGGPRGSVGFHFPGGRTQLLTEALREAGDGVTAHLQEQAKGGASPAEVFAGLCDHYTRQLESSDFVAGCPVWAVVQEAPDEPDLGPLARAIVEAWAVALLPTPEAGARHATSPVPEEVAQHATSPVPEEVAQRPSRRDLATYAIASLEGAITLARLQRSTRPIALVREQVAPLLAA
ncbi:TetR/AcrR family transcriptional regulator [Janibacter sp. G349]|uniref:TetR/AcrR family transcriptional regulator n=1 Tax=Janibacter sp. G349 TaxID=3405424 RepID=UPI003B812244